MVEQCGSGHEHSRRHAVAERLYAALWGRDRMAGFKFVLYRTLTEYYVSQFMHQCKGSAWASVPTIDYDGWQGLLCDGKPTHLFQCDLMMRAAQDEDQNACLFDRLAPPSEWIAPSSLLFEAHP